MRRTPPRPKPVPESSSPLTHAQSDSNISRSPIADSLAVPTITREHVMSDSNISLRKRKREDNLCRDEMVEMFAQLKLEQENKFQALMSTVQSGIDTHTEQNRSISTSIEFLCKKYDELVTKIQILEQDKLTDHKYIKQLESRIEQIEKTLQSSKLEVRNVPKKEGETKEDLLKIVTKVGTSLNIPVQSVQVRDVYRINTKKEGNQPIIAEFSTVLLRDKILESVKTYNKKYPTSKFSTSNLKIDGPTVPVFVSESLTLQAKKLFFMAREFAKRNNYRYCWTSRGKIYIRRKDGETLIRINSERDLEIAESK